MALADVKMDMNVGLWPRLESRSQVQTILFVFAASQQRNHVRFVHALSNNMPFDTLDLIRTLSVRFDRQTGHDMHFQHIYIANSERGILPPPLSHTHTNKRPPKTARLDISYMQMSA